MKKLNLLLIFILASVHQAFCQKPFQVNENELIQILDKFVYISSLPDHFYSNKYGVKLVKEEGHDTYSVAITSIYFVDELPKDSLWYIHIQNIHLFIILNSEITLSKPVSDESKIVTDMTQIKKIADHILFENGVRYFPFMVICKVQKERHLFNRRIVKFETYLPINGVPKKYWPIPEPIGAVTDRLPQEFRKDDLGYQRKAAIATFKNGKGKFRIKTR